MYKILFICHGNICRSPMAEFIMKRIVKNNNVDAYIESAATSTEEIGNPVYRLAAKMLNEHGISGYNNKTARQVVKNDYNKFDLLIVMDEENLRGLKRIIKNDPLDKIHKLLEYAGSNEDIEDPWYTGRFDEVYDEIEKGCMGLKEYLMRNLV